MILLDLVSAKIWDFFLNFWNFGRDNDKILIMIILYYAKGNWSLPPSLETLSIFNHQNAYNLEIERVVHAVVKSLIDEHYPYTGCLNRKLMSKFKFSLLEYFGKGWGWGYGLTCGRFWNLVSTYSLSSVKLSLTSALNLLRYCYRWRHHHLYSDDITDIPYHVTVSRDNGWLIQYL